MTPAMLGGVRLDATTGGYWEVTSDDLEKGYITFYVLRYPEPQTIEELEVLGQYEEDSYKYREFLLPVFS